MCACVCAVEKVCEADGACQVSCHAVVRSSQGVYTCRTVMGLRVLFCLHGTLCVSVRVYVEVFRCCQTVCLSNLCRQLCNWSSGSSGWGGAAVGTPMQNEKWRNNRGGGWCMCVPALMCGSGWG